MKDRRHRRAVRPAEVVGGRVGRAVAAWVALLRPSLWRGSARSAGLAVGLVAAAFLLATVLLPTVAPAAPPANFTDTLVTSGFSTIPTDVTAMADSRLLITTQDGTFRTLPRCLARVHPGCTPAACFSWRNREHPVGMSAFLRTATPC